MLVIVCAHVIGHCECGGAGKELRIEQLSPFQRQDIAKRIQQDIAKSLYPLKDLEKLHQNCFIIK